MCTCKSLCPSYKKYSRRNDFFQDDNKFLQDIFLLYIMDLSISLWILYLICKRYSLRYVYAIIFQACRFPDLIATSGDCLKIWKINDNNSVSIECQLTSVWLLTWLIDYLRWFCRTNHLNTALPWRASPGMKSNRDWLVPPALIPHAPFLKSRLLFRIIKLLEN